MTTAGVKVASHRASNYYHQLTSIVVQYLSLNLDDYPAGQILHVLWNREFDSCVRLIPPLDAIVSDMNPVHTTYVRFHFDIMSSRKFSY
jgi:hypothetical protein